MLELTNEQVAKALVVDVESEVLYGLEVDGMYYPRTFAVVSFSLEETNTLYSLADKLRMEAGYAPADGYNFYYGLNLKNGPAVDNYIICIVCEGQEEDSERTYLIPIAEDAKEEVWKVLNEQFKKNWNKDCNAILEEARKELEG